MNDLNQHEPVVCPMCGDHDTIAVNSEDYAAWLNGEYIQIAFPYLNADQRERLQTGICNACWDKSFGEEE